METDKLIAGIKQLGINTVAGVPDSTLKPFCSYLNSSENCFKHFTTPDEGAALSIAIGHYLATGSYACVYMQNSGIGNIVNPLTSLANEKIYDIPMLFIIGWRGMPEIQDEPQHKFMGKITPDLLTLLNINYCVINSNTDSDQLKKAFAAAKSELENRRQYAFVIQPNTLNGKKYDLYKNTNALVRENVLNTILATVDHDSIFVSTTGKISRELYEQSNKIYGNHDNIFMVVGGMGYANMIAYGIAMEKPDKKVICIDGDGALLMHMGNLAFLGEKRLGNYIHICMNNHVHESVGGMPTSISGNRPYSEIAKACGYEEIYIIEDEQKLISTLQQINSARKSVFLEIMINTLSRTDLERPKETPLENMNTFMSNCQKGGAARD